MIAQENSTEHRSAERRAWNRWLNTIVHQAALLLPFVGVYSLAVGFPAEHLLVRMVWSLWTAYFLFCWTSTFHETAHQTLPQPKWLTILIGRVIGTVLFTPYTVYQQSHMRHHAYLNRPNDWELWPYSDPAMSLTFRRLFVWLDLILGMFTSPYVYGRIYFASPSPIKQPEVRRAILLEYLAIIVFWGSVLSWVAMGGYWNRFLLAWFIPHWIAGVMQTGRKLTEHLGMASFDPLQGTRTVIGNNVITRLASYFNFEIFVHGPHHRFPRIEHQQLEARMHDLQSQPGKGPYPVYPTYFAATRAMFPCLFRTPGVGLNAGAGAVNPIAKEDVSEFLEDARDVTQRGWN